tara:strand:- start:76396 stop:78561 length:2166 start_codon:yes stop_codon:yes gene_type:complete
MKITGYIERSHVMSSGFTLLTVELANPDSNRVTVKGVPGEYSRQLITKNDVLVDIYGEWRTHHTYGKSFELHSISVSSQAPLKNIALALDTVDRLKKRHIGESLAVVSEWGSTALRMATIAIETHYDPSMHNTVLTSLSKHALWRELCSKIFHAGAKIQIKALESSFMKASLEETEKLLKDPYSLCVEGTIDYETACAFSNTNETSPDIMQAALLAELTRKRCSESGSSYVLIDDIEKEYVKKSGSTSFPTHPLIHYFERADGNFIQLEKHRKTEFSIAAELKRLANTEKSIQITSAQIQDCIHETPTDCQRSAFEILQHPFSIVTGLPGTGKTFIVNGFSKSIRLAYPDSNILMIGYTGTAAKRLEEMTGESAMTIHSALGYNPAFGDFVHNENNPLNVDVVVVDEASMVDMFLFESLLKAIPSHAKLALFGDVDQLASIGEGAVLRDLLDAYPSVRMTSTKRFTNGGIIEFCHNLCEGKILYDSPHNDISINISQNEASLTTYVHKGINAIIGAASRRGMNNVQIMAPQYSGDSGIDAINEYCRTLLFPDQEPFELSAKGKTYKYHPGSKIIIKKNMPNIGLFNGDIGTIKLFAKTETKNHLLTVSIKGRQIQLSRDQARSMMPAYCISIHNSQGNEYPFALIVVTKKGQRLLSRNLLNTAVSRGKLKVIVVAEPGSLEDCASRTERHRLTRLNDQILLLNNENDGYSINDSLEAINAI